MDSNKVSFAFSCHVLHEAKYLDSLLREIKRTIAAGGKLAIIEWKEGESLPGVPISHRLGSKKLSSKLKETGFRDIIISDLNKSCYLITCLK